MWDPTPKEFMDGVPGTVPVDGDNSGYFFVTECGDADRVRVVAECFRPPSTVGPPPDGWGPIYFGGSVVTSGVFGSPWGYLGWTVAREATPISARTPRLALASMAMPSRKRVVSFSVFVTSGVVGASPFLATIPF